MSRQLGLKVKARLTPYGMCTTSMITRLPAVMFSLLNIWTVFRPYVPLGAAEVKSSTFMITFPTELTDVRFCWAENAWSVKLTLPVDMRKEAMHD